MRERDFHCQVASQGDTWMRTSLGELQKFSCDSEGGGQFGLQRMESPEAPQGLRKLWRGA
jgi:hypothetical protein